MKKLYLFTVKYPFTIDTECFLDDEIKYLSIVFDSIEIIPLQFETTEKKILPNNCQTIIPVFANKFSFLFKGVFNWRVFCKMFPLLFKNRTLTDRVHRSDWIKAYITASNLLNNKVVRVIERNLHPSDVCYFYWGKWSNLLAYFWKGKCHLVSRFHGQGDLWEEDHRGFVPMRKEVVESLDAAVIISYKGEKYFKEKYPNSNTKVFPLGSNDICFKMPDNSEVIKVLSCSTVSLLKRVTLIYKSLLEIKDIEIEWTHIGDGVEMENLKALIEKCRHDNVKVKLMGLMQHEEVLDYYTKHSFNVFVNLSTNEGVPVSIMEAISCNIPIVATDVGGNSEIVTPDTGQLVSANPTSQEVADAIRLVIKGNYSPREFWNNHYNAEKNYTAFAQFLTNL